VQRPFCVCVSQTSFSPPSSNTQQSSRERSEPIYFRSRSSLGPDPKVKKKRRKTLTFTKAAGAYRENLGSERRSQSPIYSMYVYVCMYAGESVVSFFFLVRLSAAIEAGARVYRCRRNQSITELPL
jgi:hypothetical protein